MPNHPRTITANGQAKTLNEWAAESGISAKTICSRLDVLGWAPERAVGVRPDRRFRRGGRPRADLPRPVPVMRKDTHARAIVRWRSFGRDHFVSFGAWGSPEALAAYRRFAAEWASGLYEAPQTPAKPRAVSVAELCVRWVEHVGREYVKLGRRTSEYHAARSAAAKLNDFYGDTRADEFTPAKLRTVRAAWVADGKTRKTVNGYAYRLVRCFEWGVGQSLVPPAVHQALLAVENLKPGRSEAPDRPAVQAVPDEAIAATLAALPNTSRGDVVRAMVRVQRLVGLRPQHLVEMRSCDIDTRGDVWRYIPPPAGVKTYHLSKRPTFYLGPQSQELLSPVLNGCPEFRPLFGYRLKGEKWYRVTVSSYRKAIRAACLAAGVPLWHPHQLRHALATAVAERFQCIDTAAAAIGDNAATAAAVYVHVDPQERARIEIARVMG
jgi:integrase